MNIQKFIPALFIGAISFSTIANTTNPDKDKKETVKITTQETIVGVAA